MLDAGLLDETGRIADKDEAGKYASYIDEDADGGPIFVIDAAHSVYMTGKDIREVQLAKAAICARQGGALSFRGNVGRACRRLRLSYQ